MSIDANTRVGVTLLTELINEAKLNSPVIKQMGIDETTIEQLATMTIAELQALAKSAGIECHINSSHLRSGIARILRSRERETMLNHAITLGASRKMMRELVRMSSSEFNRRRTQIGLGGIRRKPAQLSDQEYERLATLHSGYENDNPCVEKIDHLRCLIYLSEETRIDINCI